MSTALKCELPGIWNLPLEGNAASCGNPNSRDGEVSRDVKWCNAIAGAGPVLLHTHHTFKLTGVQETLETLSYPSSRGWWRKKWMQALTPMGWEHCTKLCTRERWIQEWPRWMDLSYLSPQPWISFIGGLCLAFSRTPSPGSFLRTLIWFVEIYNNHQTFVFPQCQAIPSACWCCKGGDIPRLLSSEFQYCCHRLCVYILVY